MTPNAVRVGFALCGSFCTFEKAIGLMRRMRDEGYDITPIMSHNAYTMDTRFGRAEDIIAEIAEITGKSPMHTIQQAEPIGPRELVDVMLVAPCTGNTLAKIACGITDTPVTMAVKSHLRRCAPVVLALSSNDSLSANAQNMGRLMNTKNIYFVPLMQDDPDKKGRSAVADLNLAERTIAAAIDGVQLQPILMGRQ